MEKTFMEKVMQMMEEAKQDRADTRKMIESKVGVLEEKVDAVAGTVKGLASKADKHEGALADLQERVTTMETELQEMRNKKESPSFKEVTSGEVVTRLPEAGMAEAVGPPRAPMGPRTTFIPQGFSPVSGVTIILAHAVPIPL